MTRTPELCLSWLYLSDHLVVVVLFLGNSGAATAVLIVVLVVAAIAATGFELWLLSRW